MFGTKKLRKWVALSFEIRYNSLDNQVETSKEDVHVRMLLKGGLVYDRGQLVPMDIEVTDGIVTGRDSSISSNAD